MGHYLAILKHGDRWWFSLFYSVTFGGFVGMASYLPIFLHDQYELSPVTAGYLTALAALVGSGIRPLGGYVSDRFGGVRMLSGLLHRCYLYLHRSVTCFGDYGKSSSYRDGVPGHGQRRCVPASATALS